MLPLVWTRELGLISDQDAEAVRNNLYFASHLTTGVFWATLSIGALLLLLAVPALFVLLRCSRKDQNLIHYRPLNLSEDYRFVLPPPRPQRIKSDCPPVPGRTQPWMNSLLDMPNSTLAL